MAEIVSRSRGEVTVREVTGSPTGREVGAAVQSFYRGVPTKYIVWDVTNGSMSNLSTDDLQALVAYVREVAHMRAGGKTAIIVPNDLGFGLGRMIEAYGSLNELPFDFRAFRSKSDALEWLGLRAEDLP